MRGEEDDQVYAVPQMANENEAGGEYSILSLVSNAVYAKLFFFSVFGFRGSSPRLQPEQGAPTKKTVPGHEPADAPGDYGAYDVDSERFAKYHD